MSADDDDHAGRSATQLADPDMADTDNSVLYLNYQISVMLLILFLSDLQSETTA